MRSLASTSQDERVADYEVVDSVPTEVALKWLIITALIIWSGAWWLGQRPADEPTQSQGETATQFP